MRTQNALIVLHVMLGIVAPAGAELKVSPLFSDGVVIQREVDAPVWGEAEPGEAITVCGSWGKEVETTADDKGHWSVRLTTPEAGGPFEITISGTTTIEIRDVLAGDVWLCAGQSNMAGNVGKREEAKEDNYPGIRHFTSAAATRRGKTKAAGATRWIATTPQTVQGFTATGYFFGRHLHQELKVPIGLIKAAVGGTLIEPWTPAGTYDGAQGLLYDKHIAPLIPFAIKGAIWYQGEANSRSEALATPYAAHLQGMIAAWRKNWGQGDFPFYYVQLPSIGSPDRVYFQVREAMRRSLGSLPNLGMSVNIDIDEGLHPKSKHIMGPRLAFLVLRDVYGKDLVACGPLLESVNIEGGKAVCTFTETGSGLVCRGERLAHFEIAGNDGEFLPAEANIEGNSVVVSSDKVPVPASVRYAWENNPHNVTLFNKEGLPASPFCWGE